MEMAYGLSDSGGFLFFAVPGIVLWKAAVARLES